MPSESAPEPIDMAALSESIRGLGETFQRLTQSTIAAAQEIGRTLGGWLRDPETQAMLRTFDQVQTELRTDSMFRHAKSELGTDWMQ